MPITLKGVESSESVRSKLKDLGMPVLLAWSGGKDSTAAWIAMLEDGLEVVPVHLCCIPGLKFVENYLEYAEWWFGTRILRYPHPSLFRSVAGMLYQPPSRIAAIDSCGLPSPSLDDIWDMVRQDEGLYGSWVADGLKANDSLERRASILRAGAMRPQKLKASVIWDWTADETRDFLDSFGIEGPPDYQLFGCSFDGISGDWLKPIKENYPGDYETILKWFPLAGLDISRREHYGLRF